MLEKLEALLASLAASESRALKKLERIPKERLEEADTVLRTYIKAKELGPGNEAYEAWSGVDHLTFRQFQRFWRYLPNPFKRKRGRSKGEHAADVAKTLERISQLMADGVNGTEAVRQAVEEIGMPATVKAEHRIGYIRKLLGKQEKK